MSILHCLVKRYLGNCIPVGKAFSLAEKCTSSMFASYRRKHTGDQ